MATVMGSTRPAHASDSGATTRTAWANRRRRVQALNYIPLVILAVVFVGPLLFMVMSSFKPNDQIFADVQSWRGFAPVGDISWDNYRGVFERVPALRFMANSAFVAGVIVAAGLVVNSMAGFALARLRWRGRNAIFVAIIATLIVPFETIAIPLVYLVAKLPWIAFEGGSPALEIGWLNSYHVQILPFIANAFSIFLFAQYFQSIPKELDEAARVDGASWFRIYRTIIVPLSGPVFATSAILTFLPQWNSYLWPLLTVQNEEFRPVQVGVTYFFQLNTAWGEVMAYTTLITLPIVIFFLAFQRAFISSIAASGVKG